METTDITFNVESTPDEASRVRDALTKLLPQHGYGDRDQFGIKLAVEEALANAVHHGNRDNAAKHITITGYVGDNLVKITIEDEGAGFYPNAVPDPTTDEGLEKPSGRGLMMMRRFMDEVVFSKEGRCVTMRKKKTR